MDNYALGFYFSLSFYGEDVAFREVSGITKEMAVEEVGSGGENRFKYRLPIVTGNQNLVLKRAMIPANSKLIDWVADTLDEGLYYQVETHDISLSLLAPSGEVSKMWTFHRAYPIKYSISDLNSMGNEIVLETVEFAYTYFDISENKPVFNLFG